jgi:pimeloyl-ACP methyl ester carboxylesterase
MGVTHVVLDVEGLRATVVAPAVTSGRVLFCLPGGGMSRRYFDLGDGYSMAEHVASLGHTVICIDHPGVGESAAPRDLWRLTPSYVADRDAAAINELRTRYPGLAVGLGHSMGAMLTVVVQARHRCFDALALLGWAEGKGYEETELARRLSPEEAEIVGDASVPEERVVELAKVRFESGAAIVRPPAGSTFLDGSMAVDDPARRVLAQAQTRLLTVCGLASMLKRNVAEVASIDVAVIVAVGEHDITIDVRNTAPALASCPDISLYVLPGAGHNHNIAPNRELLWNRLAAWVSGIAIA